MAHAIASSDLPKYVYSYPSKRAYRRLPANETCGRIWEGAQGPLNLYIHVPFCGYRCTFCTLFLTTSHDSDLRQRYVEALRGQIESFGRLLGHMQLSSFYIGGGTPTVLEPAQFEAIFAAIRAAFPIWRADAEVGVEGSPDTINKETLDTLNALGVNRLSVGLQTLDDRERRSVGRPYSLETVFNAVELINATGFDNVNYDLIYGLEGQTRESWFHSLRSTMDFKPRTITIYPVIFRPLTQIMRRSIQKSERFLQNSSKYGLYDQTVDYLSEHGFKQNSFVRFSNCDRDGLQQEAADFAGVPLLGFGAGSRSYSARVHYGTDFAFGRAASLDIIAEFVGRNHHSDRAPSLGFILDVDEQKRRFCILNLSLGSVNPGTYRDRFGCDVDDDFKPQFDALRDEGCVVMDSEKAYLLTRKGFKYSNVLATLFQSARVTQLESEYVPM